MTNTDSQPKHGLIWERLQQAAAGARLALNRDQIIRTAITIADAEGAPAISMRRIATELGSTAMALYRHVFSKDDLLDLMLDAVFGEIALPEQPAGDWRADLRTFAYASRAVLKRHPWVLPLLISRPTLGPNYLRWFEFSLACVADRGLDIATMAQVVGVLNGYISATASYEAAEEEHTRRIGLSEADKRKIVTPYIQQVIASGRYPNFARFFTEEISLAPEQSFSFGVECVLDGIAVQLAPRVAGRARGRWRSVRSRKFSSNLRPCAVHTDSGWNCTPNSGRVRCSSAMITPSGVHAVTRSSRGTAPTTSEW